MKCSEIKEKINAYIDEELDAKTHSQVKNHLMQCAECQKELRELTQLNSFLESYDDIELPSTYHHKMSKVLTKKENRVTTFFRYAVAASIFAAFISGIFMGQKTFSNKNLSEFEYSSINNESLVSLLEGELE